MRADTETARTIEEFLTVVRKLRKRWGVPKHKELWFRAEDARYARTRLQPRLYRPRVSGAAKSAKRLLEIENDLYEEFRRCASQLFDVRTDDDWDWYFLMQHHGVPTRILDWTDGALIALHFAVRDKPTAPKNGSSVYVLDPHWLLRHLGRLPDYKNAQKRWEGFRHQDPSEGLTQDEWGRAYLPGDEKEQREVPLPQAPLLFDSDHVTRRIAAQRSRLMVFGTDPKWIVDVGRAHDSHLKTISIPAGSINRVRRELRDAGLTESVVFPDLDGLGRELSQAWEDRR